MVPNTRASCGVFLGVFLLWTSTRGFQPLPNGHASPSRGAGITQIPSQCQSLLAPTKNKLSTSSILTMTKRANEDYPSPPTSIAATANVVLSPWETWCVQQLKEKYEQALSIKCPFFRRRAADLLDATDMVIRFIVYRHKSLPFSPPGWKCQGDNRPKRIGISQTDLLEIIRNDWREDTHKGYYVTGKLTTSVYRDDVVFDGPDPDMPVKGLRKYLNAASQLFDQKQSRSELISLDIIDDTAVVAHWRMKGVLRLPWKPAIPEWTGTTTYYTDDDGLIYRHEETWDKSVLQAFLQTLCPQVADRIWIHT